MRISDWSSDLCSSDLRPADPDPTCSARAYRPRLLGRRRGLARRHLPAAALRLGLLQVHPDPMVLPRPDAADFANSEERHVVQECVRTVRPRWSHDYKKKKISYSECE